MINSATSLLNYPISLAKETYASITKNKQTVVKTAAAAVALTAIAAGLYFFGPDVRKYCSATKPVKPNTPPSKPAPAATSPQPISTTQPSNPTSTLTTQPSRNRSDIGSPEKIWTLASKAFSEIEMKNKNASHLLGTNNNHNEPTWLKSKINSALSDAWSTASSFEPEQYLAEKNAADFEAMQLFASNARSLAEFTSPYVSDWTKIASAIVSELTNAASSFEPEQYLAEKNAADFEAMQLFASDARSLAEFTSPYVSDWTNMASSKISELTNAASNAYTDCPAPTHHNETAIPSYEMQVHDQYERGINKVATIGRFTRDATYHLVSAEYSKVPGGLINLGSKIGSNLATKISGLKNKAYNAYTECPAPDSHNGTIIPSYEMKMEESIENSFHFLTSQYNQLSTTVGNSIVSLAWKGKELVNSYFKPSETQQAQIAPPTPLLGNKEMMPQPQEPEYLPFLQSLLSPPITPAPIQIISEEIASPPKPISVYEASKTPLSVITEKTKDYVAENKNRLAACGTIAGGIFTWLSPALASPVGPLVPAISAVGGAACYYSPLL